MKITINITNQEELDAITKQVEYHNTLREEPITEEDYLKEVLQGNIETWKAQYNPLTTGDAELVRKAVLTDVDFKVKLEADIASRVEALAEEIPVKEVTP